jgi:hypothetical protein
MIDAQQKYLRISSSFPQFLPGGWHQYCFAHIIPSVLAGQFCTGGYGQIRQARFDMAIFKSSDPWASITIVLSFGLFAMALFVKGFTHDLLLEAGIFLVSVKLILMAKKNREAEERLECRLAQIEELLRQLYAQQLGR